MSTKSTKTLITPPATAAVDIKDARAVAAALNSNIDTRQVGHILDPLRKVQQARVTVDQILKDAPELASKLQEGGLDLRTGSAGFDALAEVLSSAFERSIRRVLIGDHMFPIGHPMYLRCVTYHYVGIVEAVGPYEILLSNPVWVADSGRWDKAYSTGSLSDYLYGPDYLLLGRLSIVDAGPWTAPMPRHQDG